MLIYLAPCTYGSVALLDYTGTPTNRSTGTVGLCIGGMWTVVCDYSWSFRAASVACRSLHGHSGYGKLIITYNNTGGDNTT